MKEKLTNLGVSSYVYEELISTDPATVSNLELNWDIVSKNIKYLKSLGLTCIDELLLYSSLVFMLNPKDLENKIKRLDKDTFTAEVNEDFFKIEKLYQD